MDAARDYFQFTVEPTVAEFLDEPTNLRRGRLAAIVLNHMVDYWAAHTGSKVKDVMAELNLACPDAQLACDVADATKHAVLRDSTRSIKDSSGLHRPPGIFEAPFGYGGFAEACGVQIQIQSGPARQLSEVIRSVLDTWRTRMA